MERLNKIFAEWAKEDKKTELASEKVELGAIQDLQKLENRFRKEVFPIVKEITTEKSNLMKKGKKAEATLNKIENEISNSLKLIEKSAKDLGLNVSDVKEYKNVKALEDIFPNAKTVFQSVQ